MIETNGSNSLFYGKYHLLGDLAYANTNWLITPYKNYGSLTRRHKIFNTKLSKTRVCIEHSFGLLKGRWRRLLYININNIKFASMIILACCILHNYCLFNDDFLNNIHVDMDEMLRTPQFVGGNPSSRTGEKKEIV